MTAAPGARHPGQLRPLASPQKAPFVQAANASVPIPRVRVVATRPDKSLSDHLYSVGHTPPRGGCDNSYDLLPVKVT